MSKRECETLRCLIWDLHNRTTFSLTQSSVSVGKERQSQTMRLSRSLSFFFCSGCICRCSCCLPGAVSLFPLFLLCCACFSWISTALSSVKVTLFEWAHAMTRCHTAAMSPRPHTNPPRRDVVCATEQQTVFCGGGQLFWSSYKRAGFVSRRAQTASDRGAGECVAEGSDGVAVVSMLYRPLYNTSPCT